MRAKRSQLSGSAHLVVLALALVDGGGVACGTGAEVVLGGCEPVDDCRAPCDCDFLIRQFELLLSCGEGEKVPLGGRGRNKASKGMQNKEKGHTIDGANGEA